MFLKGERKDREFIAMYMMHVIFPSRGIASTAKREGYTPEVFINAGHNPQSRPVPLHLQLSTY